MKAIANRNLYKSTGRLFAAEGEIVNVRTSSTPGCVFVSKDANPNYLLMTFADDVDILDMEGIDGITGTDGGPNWSPGKKPARYAGCGC